MTMLPRIQNPDCPRPHNGCTCECHRVPGIMHFVACCSPAPGEELRPTLQDEIDRATWDVLKKGAQP